ncbi:hypothetical protein [Fusobacterium sp.]|uniref:hypothetical protein n=1 Tax=Fusobacterium sp. TaxID=68766 RepID=UPI00262B31F2|nr:hypothetical protein [Fusobacterium sp.]
MKEKYGVKKLILFNQMLVMLVIFGERIFFKYYQYEEVLYESDINSILKFLFNPVMYFTWIMFLIVVILCILYITWLKVEINLEEKSINIKIFKNISYYDIEKIKIKENNKKREIVIFEKNGKKYEIFSRLLSKEEELIESLKREFKEKVEISQEKISLNGKRITFFIVLGIFLFFGIKAIIKMDDEYQKNYKDRIGYFGQGIEVTVKETEDGRVETPQRYGEIHGIVKYYNKDNKLVKTEKIKKYELYETKEYDESGNLISEINYETGERKYYSNNKLIKLIEKNKNETIEKNYYESGNLKDEMINNGRADNFRVYSPDGKLIKEVKGDRLSETIQKKLYSNGNIFYEEIEDVKNKKLERAVYHSNKKLFIKLYSKKENKIRTYFADVYDEDGKLVIKETLKKDEDKVVQEILDETGKVKARNKVSDLYNDSFCFKGNIFLIDQNGMYYENEEKVKEEEEKLKETLRKF